MSLRLKLALIASILTLSGLGLGLGITYWSLLSLRLAELDRESRLLAEVIYDAAVFRSGDFVRIPAVVESYLTDESGLSAAQVYLDGQLLWEGGVINAPRPLDPEGLLGEEGARSVSAWRVYSFVALEEGITVEVGRPLVGTWEILAPYTTIAFPLSFVLTLLAAGAAWFSVGRALRPLKELTEATHKFETIETLPHVPGQDEPAKLARSFSHLLSRLKSQRQREQQFLAYAAHELRTPISALRAGLEAAKSKKVPASPEFLTRLHREALRLETLAQNLLALSKAEAGEITLKPLNLADLAADAYDRFLPLALEKELELLLDNKPAPALGDERLMVQAINNLLANALRFTKMGKVIIKTGELKTKVFLEIQDNGMGFTHPVEEGLGLRVSHAVALSHRGTLELLSDNEVTKATFYLPTGG